MFISIAWPVAMARLVALSVADMKQELLMPSWTTWLFNSLFRHTWTFFKSTVLGFQGRAQKLTSHSTMLRFGVGTGSCSLFNPSITRCTTLAPNAPWCETTRNWKTFSNSAILMRKTQKNVLKLKEDVQRDTLKFLFSTSALKLCKLQRLGSHFKYSTSNFTGISKK